VPWRGRGGGEGEGDSGAAEGEGARGVASGTAGRGTEDMEPAGGADSDEGVGGDPGAGEREQVPGEDGGGAGMVVCPGPLFVQCRVSSALLPRKEGGEARSISRSTPGLKISVQGIATARQRAANMRDLRGRIQEQGLDVGACRVMVLVYNEDRARPRTIGAQHIGGDELTAALDTLEEGDMAGAAEAFGRAWLDAYGMDDVDATITDVVGAFSARL